MDERVSSQYDSILGPEIYNDVDIDSVWDILKFFSIIFAFVVLFTFILTADIIMGDLYHRLVVYAIIISIEVNCLVILAYYGSLWDATRSNPVIHEKGLLLPPENVGDAYRGFCKPYMASKIVGIYPVFVIRERRKDNENYLEFRRLIIKFMDDRVCDVRTKLSGEMIKALDRMLDGKLKEYILSSNEFFNFNHGR